MLISMLLFALFVVEANLKLFSKLETRFYSQAKIAEKMHQLDQTGEELDSYISDLLSVLGDYAQKPEVFSYHEHNPSEKSVTARRNVTENLFRQLPALSGIRIIDVNGRNVHYSSFDESDLLKENGLTKIYKNYNDIIKDSDEIDFSLLKTGNGEKPKLFLDADRNRLIISQPFFWFEKYQGGNIIFYFDFISLRQIFVDMNIFSFTEEFRIFSDSDYKGGLVLDLPKAYEKEFKASILEKWTEDKNYSDNQAPKIILTSTDGNYWTLLTSAKSKYFKVSGVWPKSSFELSKDLIWLVYVCVFITIFLVTYLLFSFSSDPVTVTKKKIRSIQLGIIQEYIAEKKEVDWNRIGEQIQFRKKEILDSLKKDLLKKSGKNREKIEELLENGWNDLVNVFTSRSQKSQTNSVQAQVPGFSMEELRRMIEDVLKNVKLPVESVVQSPAVEPAAGAASPADEVEEIEEVEEVDDAEPAEEVEEIEEVEELDDAEPVEEVEEIEEVEELDDAEPVEEVDDAEPVEEVEEIEGVEELDDAEPVEEVDEVEEIEEVEELDDAEPVEEVEEVDDAEPADEVEEIEEVEELDDAEPVEEVEEVDDAEPADEVEEIEEVEELDDVEPVDEVEEVEEIEEVEELDDAEPVEEVKEVDGAEPDDEVEELDDAEPVEEVEEIEEVEELDDVEPLEEVEETEPLEELPEYDEFGPDNDSPLEEKKNTFYSVENLFPDKHEYFEDVESFIRSDRFASVDDLFAEEIALGSGVIQDNNHSSKIMDFKITKVSEIYDTLSELEEVTVPESKPYFAMTEFAKNDREIKDLQAAEADTEVIKEKDGVFQISENMDFSSPVYDKSFKALVDSVLKK